MTLRWGTHRGPLNARIMIVGEAFGEDEHYEGKPFQGVAGRILSGMLKNAGIKESECVITNVVNAQPRDNNLSHFFELPDPDGEWHNGSCIGEPLQKGLRALKKLIEEVRPNIIIATGNTAFWALCREAEVDAQRKGGKLLPTGISKWRGSQLITTHLVPGIKIIPVLHPAAIARSWADRWYTVRDLKRAANEAGSPTYKIPEYDFTIEPTFEQTMEFLQGLLSRLETGETLRLAVDIETISRRWIACLGIATDARTAFCIPFITATRPYFTHDQEFQVVKALRSVLTHPKCRVIGQNFNYDNLYIAFRWGFAANIHWDTLTAQNVLFPSTPKGLDFLSSIYCAFHVFWKEESKEWTRKHGGARQMWTYNCKDCVATFEVAEAQEKVAVKFGLRNPMMFQQALSLPVLMMMIRGVRIDRVEKKKLRDRLIGEKFNIEEWLQSVIGYSVLPTSPQQLNDFFYKAMGCKPIRKRGGKGPTTDKDALPKLKSRHPILTPICNKIEIYRSYSNVLGNFLNKDTDPDGRTRCSFNIAGTETFRFSSSENPFGSGGNLQNLTAGKKAEHLPNLRKFIVPDEGFTIIEGDLEKADAQVVAWEADDEELKQIFREHVNLHEENAKAIFGYLDDKTYAKAKRGVHAVNYAISARSLAISLGITIKEAEHFIKQWFGAHPKIPQWHERIKDCLRRDKTVRNAFGYRRIYFDRLFTDQQLELVLKEALGWIPQSTVGRVTNQGLLNIRHNLPHAQGLLQEHDSNVFQYPTHLLPGDYTLIRDQLLVPVPYDDPLTIGVDLQASTVSWGDVEKVKLNGKFD